MRHLYRTPAPRLREPQDTVGAKNAGVRGWMERKALRCCLQDTTQRHSDCTRELTAGVTSFKRPRQIKSDSSMDGEGLMRPTPN